jgi:hypothetical protein
MTEKDFKRLQAEMRPYMTPEDHAQGITRRWPAVPWDVVQDLYWSTRKVKHD